MANPKDLGGLAPHTSQPSWAPVLREYERVLAEMTRGLGMGPNTGQQPALDTAKLDALKTAEPHKVFQRAPDRVTVITAWRAWRVTQGHRLMALGNRTVWEPRQQIEAICTGPLNDHVAPQSKCQCGIWAFKSLDNLVAALQKYQNIQIVGQVSLWGRVIETENGYRAQYAYPAELWLFDNSLEELGYIYDVPVRTTEK